MPMLEMEAPPDPNCPVIVAFCEELRAWDPAGVSKAEADAARRDRLRDFGREHRENCQRCGTYVADFDPADHRSAVWGGGTAGVVLGAVIGMFRGRVLETIVYGVLIGAFSGWASKLLAALVTRLERRM